ncbi:MAG: hypothetical protein HYU61_02095 [Brevundimonas diminuta]|nr:hypothetical protein [Brevundimonas diminuta]
MTRVSTYGNYQSALLDLMSAQSRMADAQQKVNTKKNATDLVGFGRGSETVSALMTSQTRIQTFIDTNKTVTARLETQDLAMDRVADASTAARQHRGRANGHPDGDAEQSVHGGSGRAEHEASGQVSVRRRGH